jgi:hypothetical protein
MKTLALLSALFLMQIISAHATSIYDIKLKDIDGKDTSLSAHKGAFSGPGAYFAPRKRPTHRGGSG